MRTLCLIALIAFSLSGCATIVRGTKAKMLVQTEPRGASVTTTLETKHSKRARRDNPDLVPVYIGCAETPCEFKVPRRSKFLMLIEHEGHEPVQIGVKGKIAPAPLTANLTVAAGGTAVIASSVASAAPVTALVVGGGTATAAGIGALVTAGFLVPVVGVDAATGAFLSPSPNPVSLTLAPEGTAIQADEQTESIQRQLQKKGVILPPIASVTAQEQSAGDE